MMRELFRRPRGALVTFAVLLAAMTASTNAAPISERADPFRACLEGRFEEWVKARAELVVNEDAKAADIDDASVARWAVETLDACRVQAGRRDEASEARFTKHMAQWRQHIYDRVQNIREFVRPD